jgi:hypothetical protein
MAEEARNPEYFIFAVVLRVENLLEAKIGKDESRKKHCGAEREKISKECIE